MGGFEAEEAVEPALELGEVGLQGRIGQVRAPPPEGAGALEQALQGGREHAVALVDDVLDVANEMREAELMVAASPAGLAAEPIRQPHVGPPFAQEGLDDRLGAVGMSMADEISPEVADE